MYVWDKQTNYIQQIENLLLYDVYLLYIYIQLRFM